MTNTPAIVAAVDHLLDTATGHRNMSQAEADAHREAIAQDAPAPPPSDADAAAEDAAQAVVPPPPPAAEIPAQAPAAEATGGQ